MKILVKVFGLQRQRVTLNAARLSTFHHTMSPPDGASVNSPCTTDGRILVSFGIIADVHYADIPNGSNFAKMRMRYYRNSLSLLSDAIRHWNDRSDVSFVLQLGDLIDGHNKRNGTSDIALQKTLGMCAQFKGPTYHIWGNHELYNFTKHQLAESQLNTSRKHPGINIDENSHAATDSEQPCNYYHFSPAHGFRIVVIDTYDVGKLGYESTCPQFVAAERLLASKNPNEDKNSPVGLHGLDARFVEYNGGLGQTQLQWLKQVLHTADTAHEKVFIVGHIPLFVESSNASSLCWNYSEVLDVMHTFPQCIVAYIAGHDHDGGQAIDAYGVQHITVEGVIETPPGGRAFANVHVYSDKIIVDGGGGRVTSTVIKL